jgi:hypothetical protein
MESLLNREFYWLADYSSIDIDHERFMLEICGIHTEEEAKKMASVTRRRFAGSCFRTWFKDFGREQAWVLEVYLRRSSL